MGLPQLAWIKKTVHEVETHRLSSKEKIQGTALSKGLLGYEGTHHNRFPWKKCNCKQGFLLATP